MNSSGTDSLLNAAFIAASQSIFTCVLKGKAGGNITNLPKLMDDYLTSHFFDGKDDAAGSTVGSEGQLKVKEKDLKRVEKQLEARASGGISEPAGRCVENQT